MKQNTVVFVGYARFHWYGVQSIIVFISLAVKDFKFVQNWLEIVLLFRAANQVYS